MGQLCGSRMKHLLTWLRAPSRPANRPASGLFPMCQCQRPNRPAGRLMLCGLLLLVTSAVGADEPQLLDQFLGRLGLSDFRLSHMERMLAREAAADKRQELAKKLADTYAEELVAAADES